jgi:antitoxin MazE
MESAGRVSKWGDSLAVRLPKKLVEEMWLAEGDVVDVTPVGHRAAKACSARVPVEPR